MSQFSTYFYDLSTRIFKRKPKPETDLYKLTETLGPAWDDTKDQMLMIRQQGIATLAQGIALDIHGADRKLPRFQLEGDEDYRGRVLAAFHFFQQGGTEPGMRNVLDSVGYPDATIYQCYKEKYKWSDDIDPVPLTDDAVMEYLGKWAHFVIKANVTNRTVSKLQKRNLIDSINRVKPPEGKLYHLVNLIHVIEKIDYKSFFSGMRVFISTESIHKPTIRTSFKISHSIYHKMVDDSLPEKYYWKLSSTPAPFKLNGPMKLGAQAVDHGGRHRLGLTAYRNGIQIERSILT